MEGGLSSFGFRKKQQQPPDSGVNQGEGGHGSKRKKGGKPGGNRLGAPESKRLFDTVNRIVAHQVYTSIKGKRGFAKKKLLKKTRDALIETESKKKRGVRPKGNAQPSSGGGAAKKRGSEPYNAREKDCGK